MAKCIRVAHMEQTNPTLPVDKIGGEGLTPSDRFEQARYSKANDDLTRLIDNAQGICEEKMSVPKEIARKHGYNRLEWFGFSADNKTITNDFRDIIKSLPFDKNNAEKLKLSNGVLHITIRGNGWGHALHCRVDLERRIFRLHDPNVGIFQIPLQADEPLSKATNELADLLKDLIEFEYSDTQLGAFFQLTKEEAKKTTAD